MKGLFPSIDRNPSPVSNSLCSFEPPSPTRGEGKKAGPVRYPTGKSMRPALDRLSSPSYKNILIFRNRKSVYIYRRPVPQEGRFAVVTDVGCGMRWTRRCHETNDMAADGEAVWS